MIKFFKNKYLPLKNTIIDLKTRKYLINKLDFYLLNIRGELSDKIVTVYKVIKKGYTESEAIELLNIDKLRLAEDNLSRISEKLKMAGELSNDDVVAINDIYLNTKLKFSIFNDIDLIPKKK